MYRILYRFLVPGWSAKPLVSAHDRIMGTHRPPGKFTWVGSVDGADRTETRREDPLREWPLVVGWMGSQRNVPSNGSQAKSGSAWMR